MLGDSGSEFEKPVTGEIATKRESSACPCLCLSRSTTGSVSVPVVDVLRSSNVAGGHRMTMVLKNWYRWMFRIVSLRPNRRSGVVMFCRSTLIFLFVTAAGRSGVCQESEIRVSPVTISLMRQAEIPCQNAGVLSEVYVREGDAVQRGDVVAVMENEQQQLMLSTARLSHQVAQIQVGDEAAVEAARAQLREAEAGQRVREAALKIAQLEAQSDAAVRVSQAETQLRKMELDRASQARSSFEGSISESQLDRLKTAVLKGELETEKAQSDLKSLQLRPAAEQAAIDQQMEEIRRCQALLRQEEKNQQIAKLQVDLRRDEVRIAELQLDTRSVRAAFDGTIVEVHHQPGEWVEPGTPIARMIDLKTLRAEGFLSSAVARRIHSEAPVRILLSDAEGDVWLAGKITFISPEVDPVNQQVRFWAEFDNTEHKALPGMSASLLIQPVP